MTYLRNLKSCESDTECSETDTPLVLGGVDYQCVTSLARVL